MAMQLLFVLASESTSASQKIAQLQDRMQCRTFYISIQLIDSKSETTHCNDKDTHTCNSCVVGFYSAVHGKSHNLLTSAKRRKIMQSSAMLLPLPSILAGALSASKPWPVTTTRPPLQHQPLEQMAILRQQEIHDDNDLILPLSPMDILNNDDDKAIMDNPFFRVALGLLHSLRLGFADECHALITPCSWADDTAFGYGPPTPSTNAEAAAIYAHCLLHRWEGSHVGEFHAPGCTNAMFWGKATLACASVNNNTNLLPFAWVRRDIESHLQLEAILTKQGRSTSALSPQALKAGRQWHHE